MNRNALWRCGPPACLAVLCLTCSEVAANDPPGANPPDAAPTSAAAPPAEPHAVPLNMEIGAVPDTKQKKVVPAASPPDKDSEGVPLEAITVHGKRDVLDESDRRLRAKIDALPCNGCDGKLAKPTIAEKAWNLGMWAIGPGTPPDHSKDEPADRANRYAQGALQTPGNPGGGPGAPNVP